MFKTITIGAGEIGRAVNMVFGGELCDKDNQPVGKYDMLFICFGYDDKFCKEVKKYQKKYCPKNTVIFSTVPIGTCTKLGAIHSPVVGKHPFLKESIRKSVRWIGGVCSDFIDLCGEYGLKCLVLKKPEYTEWLKLRCTTLYGLNIEFARYSKKISDKLGMEFELTKLWDKDYNDLYKSLGMKWAKRYILNAPEGKIGGHCVVPNAKILNKQHPDKLVERVYENS